MLAGREAWGLAAACSWFRESYVGAPEEGGETMFVASPGYWLYPPSCRPTPDPLSREALLRPRHVCVPTLWWACSNHFTASIH